MGSVNIQVNTFPVNWKSGIDPSRLRRLRVQIFDKLVVYNGSCLICDAFTYRITYDGCTGNMLNIVLVNMSHFTQEYNELQECQNTNKYRHPTLNHILYYL